MMRNLLHLWRHERSEADTVAGLAWYPLAHRIMCEWSDTYGYSIATCACVTAALSPQIAWERNLIIADDILAGRIPSIGAIFRNVRSAQRLRNDRATCTLAYMPCGPKVYSFAHNLAGDYSVVTIDTHMVQACMGDVEVTLTLKWSAYRAFALAVEYASARVAVEPAMFQAVLWHTWKRLYPVEVKRSRRRQWSGDLGEC